VRPTTTQLIATALFALAILHTFAASRFDTIAARGGRYAGVWHLLGEVEVVFGFWAMVLVTLMFFTEGSEPAVAYVRSRNFSEAVFVFAIMVVAASRPVIRTASALVRGVARALPLPGAVSFYWVVLALVPLMGSFITEPAAMTLAALILSKRIYSLPVSTRLKYGTLGVLFVNVSIGGTLTHFAAPPVLMVAATWQWDTAFMLSHFGWRAALAVVVNATGATLLFLRELKALDWREPAADASQPPVPVAMVLLHAALLAGLVRFSHDPEFVLGLLMLFIGLARAFERHHDPLLVREALLVAFFLAGLVVLGGLQDWWLQPLLLSMTADQVFVGATLLTAFTDNAALTYLGSLVQGLTPEFKYALVAGAVTGGGLTVIANAPNPAGLSLLQRHFADEAVNPGGLLLAALGPTLVAAAAFMLL